MGEITIRQPQLRNRDAGHRYILAIRARIRLRVREDGVGLGNLPPAGNDSRRFATEAFQRAKNRG